MVERLGKGNPLQKGTDSHLTRENLIKIRAEVER